MSNQDQYFTVNIRAYLDMKEPTYIGEEELHDLLSDFFLPYYSFIFSASVIGIL
jgi:hypothetical protein